MSHQIVKELKWGVIYIDTNEGRILFQQRWKYEWVDGRWRYYGAWRYERGSWVNMLGFINSRSPFPIDWKPYWTEKEKIDFHNELDRCIWSTWSYRAYYTVDGISKFAKKFEGKKIPINFDIERVSTDNNKHWTVKVTKVPPNVPSPTSSTNWNKRILNLDSNDMKWKSKTCHQKGVAHEFGHAIGNVPMIDRDRMDEYKQQSQYYKKNYDSIMHHGSELYERHFRTITEELNNWSKENEILQGCRFTVHLYNPKVDKSKNEKIQMVNLNQVTIISKRK